MSSVITPVIDQGLCVHDTTFNLVSIIDFRRTAAHVEQITVQKSGGLFFFFSILHVKLSC